MALTSRTTRLLAAVALGAGGAGCRDLSDEERQEFCSRLEGHVLNAVAEDRDLTPEQVSIVRKYFPRFEPWAPNPNARRDWHGSSGSLGGQECFAASGDASRELYDCVRGRAKCAHFPF